MFHTLTVLNTASVGTEMNLYLPMEGSSVIPAAVSRGERATSSSLARSSSLTCPGTETGGQRPTSLLL